MKPAHGISMILTALSVLAGCAGHSDFNQAAPNALPLQPHTVVILPVKLSENYPVTEAEIINSALAEGVAKTKKFDRVIDPFSVLTHIGADKQLQDNITEYLSKMQTSGVPDKELSAKIAEVFHADIVFTMIILPIPHDLTPLLSPDTPLLTKAKIARRYLRSAIAVNVYMIDGASGTVIWETHREWFSLKGHTNRELRKRASRLIRDILADANLPAHNSHNDSFK